MNREELANQHQTQCHAIADLTLQALSEDGCLDLDSPIQPQIEQPKVIFKVEGSQPDLFENRHYLLVKDLMTQESFFEKPEVIMSSPLYSPEDKKRANALLLKSLKQNKLKQEASNLEKQMSIF